MNKLECTSDKEKVKLVSSTVILCLVYIFKTREAKQDQKKIKVFYHGLPFFVVFKLDIPFFLAYIGIFIEQSHKKKKLAIMFHVFYL